MIKNAHLYGAICLIGAPFAAIAEGPLMWSFCGPHGDMGVWAVRGDHVEGWNIDDMRSQSCVIEGVSYDVGIVGYGHPGLDGRCGYAVSWGLVVRQGDQLLLEVARANSLDCFGETFLPFAGQVRIGGDSLEVCQNDFLRGRFDEETTISKDWGFNGDDVIGEITCRTFSITDLLASGSPARLATQGSEFVEFSGEGHLR